MDAVTKTIEIEVTPERFFDVICDFAAYPQFLSHLGLVGAVVESADGPTTVVTSSVKKLGATVSYTLKYQADRPRKLSWSLVKGQMMSRNEGTWVLEDAGNGRTRATYSVEVKFGFLVPKSLVSIMMSKELPDLLIAFKKRAESR